MPAWPVAADDGKGVHDAALPAAAGRRSRRPLSAAARVSSSRGPVGTCRRGSSGVRRGWADADAAARGWCTSSHFMLRVIFALPWEGFSHAQRRWCATTCSLRAQPPHRLLGDLLRLLRRDAAAGALVDAHAGRGLPRLQGALPDGLHDVDGVDAAGGVLRRPENADAAHNLDEKEAEADIEHQLGWDLVFQQVERPWPKSAGETFHAWDSTSLLYSTMDADEMERFPRRRRLLPSDWCAAPRTQAREGPRRPRGAAECVAPALLPLRPAKTVDGFEPLGKMSYPKASAARARARNTRARDGARLHRAGGGGAIEDQRLVQRRWKSSIRLQSGDAPRGGRWRSSRGGQRNLDRHGGLTAWSAEQEGSVGSVELYVLNPNSLMQIKKAEEEEFAEPSASLSGNPAQQIGGLKGITVSTGTDALSVTQTLSSGQQLKKQASLGLSGDKRARLKREKKLESVIQSVHKKLARRRPRPPIQFADDITKVNNDPATPGAAASSMAASHTSGQQLAIDDANVDPLLHRHGCRARVATGGAPCSFRERDARTAGRRHDRLLHPRARRWDGRGGGVGAARPRDERRQRTPALSRASSGRCGSGRSPSPAERVTRYVPSSASGRHEMSRAGGGRSGTGAAGSAQPRAGDVRRATRPRRGGRRTTRPARRARSRRRGSAPASPGARAAGRAVVRADGA